MQFGVGFPQTEIDVDPMEIRDYAQAVDLYWLLRSSVEKRSSLEGNVCCLPLSACYATNRKREYEAVRANHRSKRSARAHV
jgi:hypothetical protein